MPVNIDLLSETEKINTCETLTANFKGEKQPFSILCIPRTVDMEVYLTSLSNRFDEEILNPKKKMLLNEMISEASRKIMSGSNFEHQFYIQVWENADAGSEKNEQEVKERLKIFGRRYESVQQKTKTLDDTELLKLCNLFGNSNNAVFETYEPNNNYIPIPRIKRNDN